MKKNYFNILIGLYLFFPMLLSAKPEVLDKGQGINSDLRVSHEVIPNIVSSLELTRLVLLDASYNNRKIRWAFEEEGDGYIIVRWDNRHDTIVIKMEYDEKYIQLKYVDGNEEFKCLKNVEGICYKNNGSDYYGFLKRLRTSITRSLQKYASITSINRG